MALSRQRVMLGTSGREPALAGELSRRLWMSTFTSARRDYGAPLASAESGATMPLYTTINIDAASLPCAASAVCRIFPFTRTTYGNILLLIVEGNASRFASEGHHRCEYLLRDFLNTERHCRPNSLIALHDCLPLEAPMAERSPNAVAIDPLRQGMGTSDVWRTAAEAPPPRSAHDRADWAGVDHQSRSAKQHACRERRPVRRRDDELVAGADHLGRLLQRDRSRAGDQPPPAGTDPRQVAPRNLTDCRSLS
jgi:hypothetical protein